ncbi:MAG TPA: OmpA family protein, partial [Longimicrobiales bacterium]|nr:OmpA family protein [Longimicrobiales bacterium]
DQSCIAAAEREGRPVEITDASGNVVERPVAFVNFDFTPGDRVLFAEDFTRDQSGNFPQRLEFERGNMEVAEWDSGRWLRGTSWPSAFMIPLPEMLPERFTVEMEVVPGQDGQHMKIRFSERPEHFVTARYFQGKVQGGVVTVGDAVAVGSTQDDMDEGTPFLLRIMVDGRYAKVYAGGTRVANMPNADLGRADRIWIELPGSDDEPAYVRNIRIAAGGRQLYDALSESGRVATQGIYFDTGSDRIKPESAPTLKQIGDMLKQHGELRLSIEGHTDNVGSDEANVELSQRRAAAVKAYLERELGIDSGRLEAVGLGASAPAAPNDTQEGRQQNRRVELVRL